MNLEKEYNTPVKKYIQKTFIIESRLTDDYIQQCKESSLLKNLYKDQLNGEWIIYRKFKSERARDDAFDELIRRQTSNSCNLVFGHRTYNQYRNYIYRKKD